DIDRVDRVGGEHLLVGAEGMRHGEAVGHGARLGLVSARDGGDDAVLRILDGRHDEFAADLGRRQDSETQHDDLSSIVRALIAPGRLVTRYVPRKRRTPKNRRRATCKAPGRALCWRKAFSARTPWRTPCSFAPSAGPAFPSRRSSSAAMSSA